MAEAPVDELVRWNGTSKALLLSCLHAAVPLRIAELAAMTAYERGIAIEVWTAGAAEPLGSNAEALLRKTRNYPDEPGTARMFGHLSRAIAALACTPGGVAMFGIIWCARHHQHGTSGTEHCADCAARPDDEIPIVDQIPDIPRRRAIIDVQLPARETA